MWGCVAYYQTPDSKHTELVARAIKSVFIEYAHNGRAYRLLVVETNTIVESKDVEFFKDKFLEMIKL